MVNKLILTPIGIMIIAALLVAGTLSGSGAESLNPYTQTCNLPSNWYSQIGGIGNYAQCQINNFIFQNVVQNYIFNVIIQTSTQANSTAFTSTYSTVICTSGNAHGCLGFETVTVTITNTDTQQSTLSPYQIQIGFLSILLVVLGTIVIASISIAGSGLNPASIYIIFKSVGYVLVWLILSSLGSPLFYLPINSTITDISMPQPFGSLLYLFLTILYLFGIFQDI